MLIDFFYTLRAAKVPVSVRVRSDRMPLLAQANQSLANNWRRP
jgi:uncharacterized protein with von Willebrand factor type A (vWA) domain